VEKNELLPMVSFARQELSEAEAQLEQLVGAIPAALRADKTGMSSVVEDAFARLRRARSMLAELEARLSSSD